MHIEIEHHGESKIAFFNWKRYYSINLLAVASYDLTMTFCMAGWPGCSHDAWVFRHSNLAHRLQDLLNVPGCTIHDSYHLVGDGAYPLLKQIMIPFRCLRGNLPPAQLEFNMHLSSKRQVLTIQV